MKEPTISLCVQGDVLQALRWILKEFNKNLKVTQFHSLTGFESALSTQETDLLILDAAVSEQSILTCLQKLKGERPGLKIILIVSPIGSREAVMEIIKAKMVNGLVVKPFTGEVICKYVGKELDESSAPEPPGVR